MARATGSSHAQALDQLAQDRGYPNWSLLVKNAEPEPDTTREQERSNKHRSTLAEPVILGSSSTEAQPPFTLRMDADRSELAQMVAIAKRFESIMGDTLSSDRLSLLMDLEACHCNGCPLDLGALRDAERDMDLVHDVAGISRHLDRETGQLQNLFRPRYAASRARP